MSNSESQKVRVRFAPSPTGYLHVGGARTAIFNWLFARQNKGKFLLRIEDTDVARSGKKMVDAIFEGLKWLGLEWDRAPLFQSERFDVYKQFVVKLIKEKKAYKCFCTPERLQEIREKAKKEKSDYKYDRACRNLKSTEIRESEKKGLPFIVRMKVEEGITSFKDLVYGNIKVDNRQIDDFVILRSDGHPTYHLAVVVDDHEMKITHIIRGDDHLSNTPKHILLYKALGWNYPEFVHVPLILGADRQRLSKRHGATAMDEYKKAGYLPEAMFNFLTLLGWSSGDDREIFSRPELIQEFSLGRIMKKSAVFDEKKLQWMNGQYLMKLDNESILNLTLPELYRAGLITPDYTNNNKNYLVKIVDLLKTRIKRLSEFSQISNYFFQDPSSYEEKGIEKHWQDPHLADYFTALSERFTTLSPFVAERIESVMREFAAELNVSAAKLIHPTRIAITGVSVSPGLFEIMEMLGRKTVIRRLERARQVIANHKVAVEEESL